MNIHVNCDTQDEVLGTSGVDWVQFDSTVDELIFSNGSDTVADGEIIPNSNQLNHAGVVLDGTQQTVPHYFIADNNVGTLKEIHNAGNNDKRYVFAFEFTGATASEPVLEVWDDSNMDSINSYSLGNGNASNSWIKGITTTDELPGADWVGSALAGSSDGHYLELNGSSGALSGAKNLYCNLKIVIPSTASVAGSETPYFVVKYTSN